MPQKHSRKITLQTRIIDTTHDAILTLFANYIEAEAGAETFFLAIQPEQSEVGSGLSTRVERAAKEVAAVVNEIVLDSKQ